MSWDDQRLFRNYQQNLEENVFDFAVRIVCDDDLGPVSA